MSQGWKHGYAAKIGNENTPLMNSMCKTKAKILIFSGTNVLTQEFKYLLYVLTIGRHSVK